MNKKLNTILFIIVATLVCLSIMAILSLVPLIIFWHFFVPNLDTMSSTIISMVLITAAVIGTFPIYSAIIKQFQKRVPMEKYFDPMFTNLFKKNRP